MDIWQETYATNPKLYETLIRHEDYKENLLSALAGIAPFEDRRIVEFGAGTGRVTRLIAPLAEQTLAFDNAEPMLRTAHHELNRLGTAKWTLALGDNREMPVASGIAHITIQGWSFGHLIGWIGSGWQVEINRAIQEMARLTQAGGFMIMLETLGTGSTAPLAPDPLLPYYGLLESLGFQHQAISTDYRYPDMALARSVMIPFFGPTVLDHAQVTPAGVVVPEWTGIWWKQV